MNRTNTSTPDDESGTDESQAEQTDGPPAVGDPPGEPATGGTSVSRRRFLEGVGIASLLGIGRSAADDDPLFQMGGLNPVDDPIGNYPYRDWEDLYREQWDWDSVSRSTHSVNCTGSCSWNVYVKNGQVWREEQAGDYPRFDESLPDPNPRGCQKGACYTDYVNADERIKHPLKRVGERGEGKWRRISWDEALTEIAEHVVDEVQAGRYDAISGFTPIPAMSPVSFASGSRLINLLGGVSHSFYDWYSDLPPGQPITWGTQTDNAESADWYNADYIIAWGSNINVTRIPDAKYFLESGYNGTKRVGVFTDYSQTAIHTDEWLSPDSGTDTALALGMARTIVDEELYDEAHLKEQTDMPLLVRQDTGKFLRASEVPSVSTDADRPEWMLLMLDSDGRLREAPGSLGERDGQKDYSKSIELDFDPQLDGETAVRTEDGRVRVRTVWAELRDELDNWGPETVHDETGVGEETYQRVAREFAEADKAKIIQGKGVNDWYHNDLGNRALQLLVTLTGNLGEQGTGLDHYVGQEKIWTFHGWKSLSFPTGNVRGVPTTLWTYYHAGILDNTDADTAAKIRESIDEGWMPVYPEERADGSRPDPTTMFVWRGNYFNQAKGNVAVEEELWPKLDLVVDINFRMDSTALYSDIVLPTASHYEKHDLSMTDMHSYVHPFTPAVEPLGESKTDWQIFRELAAKIQEVATERGVGAISDRKFDRDIDLQSVYDDYVRDWETGEADALAGDRAACEYILEHSEESNPSESDDQITFADTVEQPQRLLAAGDHWTSDIEEGEAYAPWKDFVQDKNPWPTVTGRQQYYIDHDWFLELGEQLPTHKEGPTQTGGDYPMEYNTPHGRWSIHSTWRDNEKLLRLQRGEPVVYLHPEDAAERGIEDGDTVEVFNDLASVELQAKLYPSSQRGTARMYFAWERFQFDGDTNFNSLVPMYMKPTQLVQYPEDSGEHLYFFPNYWGPTGVNSDVRVDVRKGGGDAE
ncbi:MULTISPECIES: molybdopterin-dependent oxidoreductase [unclassified Haloferax]|uniref:molybdopterin-dependent oxidoreductase n=1 Tax=unclassified Haloferax TaxID=2625095 RepID=UPI0002B00C85|nr:MULTISPECIES: molybdopterin-dependent oxidoreductase [unclassified Haloferax]ELZ61364.1 nitrate reductase, catalytic subunit [Haloferax sp. ATCC BAA-645]ELZ61620.1 nitrate reductase, catalytic subunit [Haloferax sp. ATCC BAA-646]ELZ71376.1 nitrate reductase, catalytic subunit [Haloferax sp. ATCC BAA-644]